MKKLFAAIVATALTAVCAISTTACDAGNTIYVNTNAFFAPFEYYDGDEIKGVDIDIMNMVGEKLGKKVIFENTEFGPIIDNVQSGKRYDCGAAGITITEERAEKVAFSTPYYTAKQYVVFAGDTLSVSGTLPGGIGYVLWESLAGMKIGVQTDTTGDIYVTDEINATEESDDYDYTGTLYGTGATVTRYDNAQIAIDALGTIDAVVIDELPAQYMVSHNANLHCYALYYDAETATEEQYAICVTKGNDELLNAINDVLKELGSEGIQKLVAKHLGLD